MTTRRSSTTGKTGKKQAKRLYSEAFKMVEDNAGQIAKSLYESTKKGKVMSTKLLVDLAEENVDVDEAVETGPLRSLALRLAAQPQWKGDPPPAKTETETNPEADETEAD